MGDGMQGPENGSNTKFIQDNASCNLVEARYQAITETSVDAIVTTNAAGEIITWNKGAEKMFGHGREIVGKNVLEIIPEHYREDHTRGMKRYLETGEKKHIGQHVELEGLRANGEIFPLELSLSTWEGEGCRYYGAIIRDLTERKRTESLREEVHRLMRHDLRSPLVGIGGMARSLLKNDDLNEEQLEKLGIIEHLGSRAVKLIDRSRLLLRIEKGEFELEPTDVDLVAMLLSLEQSCSPEDGATGVPLQLSIQGHPLDRDQEPVIAVQGDPVLLETMLENLLRNAVEASPKDSDIAVDLSEKNDVVVVDVHNQGEVPASVRKRFFEPYATAGKEHGTGLGTYSAKLVANAHGGDIDFTTSPQEGTHVVVSLPKTVKEQKKDPS